MSTHISGLAATVRASAESETFDLAGQNTSTITSTITSAFSDPFPLIDMIRITFITGAGKLGRQKYDENAAKAVTSALRDLGFEEDRGASCVPECGGTFKLQHDTGKNLKTVVVFPNITGSSGGELEEGVAGMEIKGKKSSSLLPEGSPEHMMIMSSKQVFEKMITSKCPSWAQKKGSLQALHKIMEQLKSLEEKLLTGQPLEEEEQELYDSISLDGLNQKESIIKKLMQDQVEHGQLTQQEKETLLDQVGQKLDTMKKEISEAEKENKVKKVEKIKSMKEKAEARHKMLEGIAPKAPHRLRHEAEIAKLRVEMRPLLKLEEDAKGRLLTLKETTAISRKDEILEEIEKLEESSRGWFESDEAFQVRVQATRAAVAAIEKKQKSSKKSTTTASKSSYKPVSSWVTPATKKRAPAKTTKKSGGSGGVFSQMMMDSDSDSD